MKTKHTELNNIRKQKRASKCHKVQAVQQNVTRILNIHCSFTFRHQLYRLIYRKLGICTFVRQYSKIVLCEILAFRQNAIRFGLLRFVLYNVQASDTQKISCISF